VEALVSRAIMAGMFVRHGVKCSGASRAAAGRVRARSPFEDALNDCFALSELAMDMVEAVASSQELIWIQNGFRPPRRTRCGKPRRQAWRS